MSEIKKRSPILIPEDKEHLLKEWLDKPVQLTIIAKNKVEDFRGVPLLPCLSKTYTLDQLLGNIDDFDKFDHLEFDDNSAWFDELIATVGGEIKATIDRITYTHSNLLKQGINLMLKQHVR